MYALFDQDGSNDLDFGEWLAATVRFCTYARGALVSLAFHLADSDADGAISAEEVAALARGLADDPALHIDAAAVLAAASPTAADGSGAAATAAAEAAAAAAPAPSPDAGAAAAAPAAAAAAAAAPLRITERAFMSFALRNPAITLPALRLQEKLRAEMGGEEFWEAASRRREAAAAAAAAGGAATAGGAGRRTSITKSAPAGVTEVTLAKTFAATVFHPGGGGSQATVHPETVLHALQALAAGRASGESDTEADDAARSYAAMVGAAPGAIAAALAAGLSSVIAGRAGKYARRGNSPAVEAALAAKAARDAASAAAIVERERREAAAAAAIVVASAVDGKVDSARSARVAPAAA